MDRSTGASGRGNAGQGGGGLQEREDGGRGGGVSLPKQGVEERSGAQRTGSDGEGAQWHDAGITGMPVLG